MRSDPPAFPTEDDPSNGEVVSKGECPKCDTWEGNVTYADGHAYCFSCKHRTPKPADATLGAKATVRDKPPSPPRGQVGDNHHNDLLRPTGPGISSRGITAETRRKYGYFCTGFSGQTVDVAQYTDPNTGEIVAQKVRFQKEKGFAVIPKGADLGKLRLFGHQVYGDRFDRQVIVTEGELDAMSVAQAVDFKVAVVSVNCGAASAAKSLKANYRWLDRFGEIVLWFDDDDAGRAAVAECAKLFAVGKVRIAKVNGKKDANEVLQAGKPGDIVSAVYMATSWRPAGIVNAAASVQDVLAPLPDAHDAWSYKWPWQEVTDMLGPIKPGQVCYHVAGTGIGKTTGIAEIQYSLLQQDPTLKIAILSFEDTRRDVMLRLLSISASKRLDLEPLPDADMRKLHEKVFSNGQIELFDPDTAEWSDAAILGYLRYCVKALDCRVVFLDPLSFIAAGLSRDSDERRDLDRISRDLAALAKELSCHLQIAHHLKRPEGTSHEEGGQTSLSEVRGSGGIANFATFVIGHERNQQAEGDASMVTQLRALKNRARSITGVMVSLIYSLTTGRLVKTAVPFPGPTRGKTRGHTPPPFPQSTKY